MASSGSVTGRTRQKYKKKSQLRMVWQRFRKNKLAFIGLIVLLLLAAMAFSADLIANYEEDAIFQNAGSRLQPPSSEHWFGTDGFGRDLFARVIFGARTSLSIGFTAIVLALCCGVVIGSVAGYYGGWVDNLLMRAMDILLAIPNILMAIIIVAVLGASTTNLLLALAVSEVPRSARVVRSAVLSIRDAEYIEAAVAYGARDKRIILQHILPNAIGPIIVQSTLSLANIILNISFLSFIGLGVPSPTPEWGTILSENRQFMRNDPYLMYFPGLSIMIAVLSLNLIGDGLRDALDPKLKN